jgi:hypothetical protein
MQKITKTYVLLLIVILQIIVLATGQNENNIIAGTKHPHPIATGGILYQDSTHVNGMTDTAQIFFRSNTRYRDHSLHLTKPSLKRAKHYEVSTVGIKHEILQIPLLQKVLVTNSRNYLQQKWLSETRHARPLPEREIVLGMWIIEKLTIMNFTTEIRYSAVTTVRSFLEPFFREEFNSRSDFLFSSLQKLPVLLNLPNETFSPTPKEVKTFLKGKSFKQFVKQLSLLDDFVLLQLPLFFYCSCFTSDLSVTIALS